MALNLPRNSTLIGQKNIRATVESAVFENVSKTKGTVPAGNGVWLESDKDGDGNLPCTGGWSSWANEWGLNGFRDPPGSELQFEYHLTKTFTYSYDQETCTFITTCEFDSDLDTADCNTNTNAWSGISQTGIAPWSYTTVLNNCSDVSGASSGILSNTRNYPQGWSTVSGSLTLEDKKLEVSHTLDPTWQTVSGSIWSIVQREEYDFPHNVGGPYISEDPVVSNTTTVTDTVDFPYRSYNGHYANLSEAQSSEPWVKGGLLFYPAYPDGPYEFTYEGSWGGRLNIQNNHTGKWRLTVTSSFSSYSFVDGPTEITEEKKVIVDVGEDDTITFEQPITQSTSPFVGVTMNVTEAEKDINVVEGAPPIWETAELPDCDQILISHKISSFWKTGEDRITRTVSNSSTALTLTRCGAGSSHTSTVNTTTDTTSYDEFGNWIDSTDSRTLRTTDAGSFDSDTATDIKYAKSNGGGFSIPDVDHRKTTIRPYALGFSFGDIKVNDLVVNP